MTMPLGKFYQVEHAQIDDSPMVMTKIYDAQVNLAIWQRKVVPVLQMFCESLIFLRPGLQLRTIIQSAEVAQWLENQLPQHAHRSKFAEDVQQLAEMYADLFDLTAIGLRLSVLGSTMCPRFHTDQLACRLVTTYYGQGSEWLPETSVNRCKLGQGANGLPDAESGVLKTPNAIQQLQAGEVALLKGEGWLGSEVKGIVHRSPQINPGDKRVLLTFDFAT